MWNCVKKIGQYFVMSRYILRNYDQNSKKQSWLDSPEQGESRKVTLTPAERAMACRDRKGLCGLDRPSTSTAALRNSENETSMVCSRNEATTPMECTGSENDMVMMDSPQISVVQPREDFDKRWSRSNRYLDEAFLTNDFGHACDVCDRLWFRKDLKSPTTNHVAVFRTEFDVPNLGEFSVCNTCRRSLNSKKIPPLAKTHGFRYPPKPRGLPSLDPISERLTSPRLPFMQIHTGSRLHPSQRATRINRIFHVSNTWRLLWSH
jgi:hypothetical protein